MICKALHRRALSKLSSDFHVRTCRPEELPIWKAMPFDDPDTAHEYEPFMTQFFEMTYGGKEDLFFSKTLFICDHNDIPVATCLLWKAYDEFNTIHWLKVLPGYEGLGIGRALLSLIMKNLSQEEYPVYLHTQPESYRAIKLYSDFGFELLKDDPIGMRSNDLEECLPILEDYMPKEAFLQLRVTHAPKSFLEKMQGFDTNEF